MPPHPEASPDPAELERLALALARDAARVVREGRAAGLDVDSKSTSTDLVTDVDRRTERFLIDEIARLRPGDAVLGEEGGAREGGAGPDTRIRWIIDPVDGTVNFVLGIPQYAVSVAAEVDGVVVAGAVCNPVSGETFHAYAGGGAHLGTAPLRAGRDVALERAVVGTGFSYDPQIRIRQIEVVRPMLPRVADIRRLGSASLDICFVAAGRLDAYFEAGLYPWDHAAAGLIAAEAGCVLTGTHGAAVSRRMLAVTRPALADAFFALLEDLDADSVLDGVRTST